MQSHTLTVILGSHIHSRIQLHSIYAPKSIRSITPHATHLLPFCTHSTLNTYTSSLTHIQRQQIDSVRSHGYIMHIHHSFHNQSRHPNSTHMKNILKFFLTNLIHKNILNISEHTYTKNQIHIALNARNQPLNRFCNRTLTILP